MEKKHPKHNMFGIKLTMQAPVISVPKLIQEVIK